MLVVPDPELNIDEQSLFEFMRDGVITELRQASRRWHCPTSIVTEMASWPFHGAPGKPVETIHVDNSALGALMKARAEIIAAKLSGWPVYSREALRKRTAL